MPHATGNPADRTATRADLAAADFLGWYTGHTRAAYEIDLMLLFDWCALEQLDPFDVTRLDLERFVRHLVDKRGNGPSTIRRRIACIRRFYRLAAHDGHIPKSPAEFVRLPRRYASDPAGVDLGLNRQEMAALLTAARAARPVDAALVALMGLMGLRVSEACALTVEQTRDVEHGHRVLKFVGKGGKPATAPIPVPVARILDTAAAGRITGPLLLRPGHGPMNRVAAARAITRLAAAAGIERHITPHDLRRGYVSGLLDAGVALRDAQTAARHADPRMTARYDRARMNLDRHGNYQLAAWIAGAA